MKICDKCKKKVGPRSKKCKHCGYDFAIAKEKEERSDIAQGSWVRDIPKGMAQPIVPDELPKNTKLTKRQLQDLISYEGLGFCIHEFVPSALIGDKRVATAWEKARKAMISVVDLVFSLDKSIGDE